MINKIINAVLRIRMWISFLTISILLFFLLNHKSGLYITKKIDGNSTKVVPEKIKTEIVDTQELTPNSMRLSFRNITINENIVGGMDQMDDFIPDAIIDITYTLDDDDNVIDQESYLWVVNQKGTS